MTRTRTLAAGPAVRIPDQVCPRCRGAVNAATPGVRVAGGTPAPRPGMSALCMHCGEALTFGDDLTLEVMTEETKRDLEREFPIEHLTLRTVQEIVRARRRAGPLN